MIKRIREIKFSSDVPLIEVTENRSLRDRLWKRFREEKRWLSGTPDDGKCASCKINEAILQAYGEAFNCDCGGSVHISELQEHVDEWNTPITEVDRDVAFAVNEYNKLESKRLRLGLLPDTDEDIIEAVDELVQFKEIEESMGISRHKARVPDKGKPVTPKTIRKAYNSF